MLYSVGCRAAWQASAISIVTHIRLSKKVDKISTLVTKLAPTALNNLLLHATDRENAEARSEVVELSYELGKSGVESLPSFRIR